MSKKEKAISLMGKIVGNIRKAADSDLKAVDLTFTQFGTLFEILQHPGSPMSQRELATAIETDTTTIMVVCDSLEKKGCLKRNPDSGDRRINRLEITEKGRKAVEKAFPIILNVFSPLTGSITDSEASLVVPILEKMNAAIRVQYAKPK
jgi:MarR family transcriptional regulator, transcriptional regulator for hemolysin